MGGVKNSYKNIVFRLVVFVSICVVLSYAAGGKLFNWKNSENLPDGNYSKPGSGQLQKSLKNYNKEEVLIGKPLPVNAFINEVKPKLPAINNVILTELKNGEQTVVLAANPQQQNTDVVLAAKGVRTKWIIRFTDNDPCGGKILIEKFGLIVPVVGESTILTFTPWKDFMVTCDKGMFNYYVKVVDNMNLGSNNSNQEESSTPKAKAKNNTKPSEKTTSSSEDSMKQSNAAEKLQEKPEESVSKPENIPVEPTNTPEPTQSGNTVNEQEKAVEDSDANAKQEEQKKGFFDHLFHHGH